MSDCCNKSQWDKGNVGHTQGSVLEGENNNISDTLKWGRSVRSGESFCDGNSDAAMDFSSLPMRMLKEFSVKGREA